MTTVEHISAYRDAQHNLVAAETAPEPVEVAEITAFAFTITNTPALLGRYVLPSDEADAASPVVVIGYQAWQRHFARDPNVVGRTVRLGGVARTVVGVMPEGFEFPSSHEFWIPLRVNPLEYPPGEGPSLEIFGRLAPGVTIEQAQAEFAAVAQQTAAARPQGALPLRARVVPYTQLGDPTMVWALRVGQLFSSALTVLVAINLAILIYARTVTRLGELAVRSALGASRRRILTQLFIEALALALLGAAAGLAIAGYALEVIQTMNETGELMPYWITFGLSPRAVFVALGLAVLSALIIGVLPGLKATGVSMTANLHELHGRSGTRLGVTWTALIVAQVAVAVAVLPAAVFISARVIRGELAGHRLPRRVHRRRQRRTRAPTRRRSSAIAWRHTSRTLLAKLEGGARRDRRRVFLRASGLGADQSDSLPGGRAGARACGTRPGRGHHGCAVSEHDKGQCRSLRHLWRPMLAGRAFAAADLGTTNVIVNRSFVEMYLQEPNPLGLVFRYDKPNVAQVGWHQIVGVVHDFPAFPIDFWREGVPTIYHPAGVGDISPIVLSVRFAGNVPATFINRFRHIGAEVDPALQLTEVGVLSDRFDELRALMRSVAWATALVTAQRPAALGRRRLRVDVLYGRAAHPRDRYPHGAWRAAAATGAERVRTRRVADRRRRPRGLGGLGRRLHGHRRGRAAGHATPADRGRDHGARRAAGDARSRATGRADSGHGGPARGGLTMLRDTGESCLLVAHRLADRRGKLRLRPCRISSRPIRWHRSWLRLHGIDRETRAQAEIAAHRRRSARRPRRRAAAPQAATPSDCAIR